MEFFLESSILKCKNLWKVRDCVSITVVGSSHCFLRKEVSNDTLSIKIFRMDSYHSEDHILVIWIMFLYICSDIYT